MTNDITDNNELNDALAAVQNFQTTVSFNVIVIDPCDNTVLTPIGLTSLTITNGQPDSSVSFNEVVDTVQVANNNQPFCG